MRGEGVSTIFDWGERQHDERGGLRFIWLSQLYYHEWFVLTLFLQAFFFFFKLVEEKKSDGLLIKEYKLLHDKEESTVVTWGLTILYKIR